MGYYIQGPLSGKGAHLVREYGATACSEKDARAALDSEDMVPVCVVDNGMFDAAALAYDKQEFDVFAGDTSGRPKRWYIMSRARAYELSGYKVKK
jgi:hypothetical protein